MSRNRETPRQPAGELVIRTIALPRDTNAHGDIFGGWLLAQMDLGGSVAAREQAGGRVTTIAIDAMRFWHPVHVGDTVCCYANLLQTGRTSLSYMITAWATPGDPADRRCVTEAQFTYVAIDEIGRPRPLAHDRS